MIKTAFIGAGGRARSGHYPVVTSLAGARLEAVAELDGARMEEVVSQYGIPRAFSDHRQMLDEIDPDAVYAVMGETFVKDVAVECMDAGKHVFIEKPAGANTDETQELLEAAERNGVFCMVGFQRRYSAVTVEALRLARARGPVTLAVGEFHKPELSIDPLGDSTLWSDVSHMVDWVRYVIDSEVVEVTAYQDTREYERKDSYNGLIRFANDGVGILTANRSSGGRYMRGELHSLGVGCYLRIPEEMEVMERGEEPRTVTGAELAGIDETDKHGYSGERAMHEHFIECVRTGETPNSDLRDVIHTFRLVDQLEGTK